MIVSILTALLVAAPMTAQTAAPAPSAPAAMEKKVGRQMEADTGSHFPGKRICHTASEWASIDATNADGADAFSRQALRRGIPGNP